MPPLRSTTALTAAALTAGVADLPTVAHAAPSTGAGHAVSTSRLHIAATSGDGERLRQQGLAHDTGAAVPEADAADVRRSLATTDCR